MNNRKITISIIVILVLAVISLGIAFATFSTVLNINGSAEVQMSSWDIYFTTLASGGTRPSSSTAMPSNTIAPTGTVSDATASIVATTFTWSANFKSPGDKVVYTIYVKNGGSYNAKVTSINTPAIQCTTDPKNVCSKLSYGLYTDSAGTTELTTSFTVDAGDTETFYLVAKLADDYGGTSGENLAGSDVTTSQISATVTFGQEGTSSSSGNGGSGGNSGGSGSGNVSPSNSTQYLYSYDYNGSTYTYEWTDNLDDLAEVQYYQQTPTAYIKKVNNITYGCIKLSNEEYCYTGNETPSDFIQMCSNLGGEFAREWENDDSKLYCYKGDGYISASYGEYEYNSSSGECDYVTKTSEYTYSQNDSIGILLSGGSSDEVVLDRTCTGTFIYESHYD